MRKPQVQEKALTDINAGKPFGLSRWVRYEPESGKFFLFEYLEIFIQRLGFEVQLYDSLDGQKLVPYMCVLRRDQWEVARSRAFVKHCLCLLLSAKASWKRIPCRRRPIVMPMVAQVHQVSMMTCLQSS